LEGREGVTIFYLREGSYSSSGRRDQTHRDLIGFEIRVKKEKGSKIKYPEFSREGVDVQDLRRNPGYQKATGHYPSLRKKRKGERSNKYGITLKRGRAFSFS